MKSRPVLGLGLGLLGLALTIAGPAPADLPPGPPHPVLTQVAPVPPTPPTAAVQSPAPPPKAGDAGVAAPGAPGALADAGAASADEGVRLDVSPPDEAKTPAPKAEEWLGAPLVKLTRLAPSAAGCRAYRVREWLKIHCGKLTASAISLLAGDVAGVAFWLTPPADKATNVPGDGEVQLPLRRGDRRLIQVWTFGPGYEGPMTVLPAFVIQEQWVDGAAAPMVTIL